MKPVNNQMAKMVKATSYLPKKLQSKILSKTFGRVVPFVGTASIIYESVSANQVVVSIANKRPIQNHIKGVHAIAMALIAETATGFVAALNTPDDRILLIKSMNIDYKKVAKGSMQAVATLTDSQRAFMIDNNKGELAIPIRVTDETGEEPIAVKMVWAWLPKNRH